MLAAQVHPVPASAKREKNIFEKPRRGLVLFDLLVFSDRGDQRNALRRIVPWVGRFSDA
jgi:hypothetical protein